MNGFVIIVSIIGDNIVETTNMPTIMKTVANVMVLSKTQMNLENLILMTWELVKTNQIPYNDKVVRFYCYIKRTIMVEFTKNEILHFYFVLFYGIADFFNLAVR